MYDFSFISFSLYISTVIAVLVAVYICQFCENASARYLVFFELTAAIWSFCNAFEAAALTVPLKIFWSQLSYFGIVFSPVTYFLFALAYTQKVKYLTLRNHILILVIPLITLCIVLVDSWMPLVWSNVVIQPHNHIAIYSHGPWYWVFIAFTYLLLVAGITIIVTSLKSFTQRYYRQTILISFATFLSVLPNTIYVTGINPLPGLDLSPVVFGITGLIIAFTIFRYKIFDIIPIARGQLVERMTDAVMVLDEKLRIVDSNPAVLKMLNQPGRELVGHYVWDVLKQDCDLQNNIKENRDTEIEIAVDYGNGERIYDVQILKLLNKSNLQSGLLIIWRNITEKKRAEKEREELLKNLQEALVEVKKLSGLLPICASCKKIRDDSGYWHEVESFVMQHSYARFSHGICPDCRKELYPEFTKNKD